MENWPENPEEDLEFKGETLQTLLASEVESPENWTREPRGESLMQYRYVTLGSITGISNSKDYAMHIERFSFEWET